MNKLLAVCIPTYNRHEAIRRTLEIEAPLLCDKVDLHIYDSSDNSSTENVVRDYSNRFGACIKYHRMSSNISSNEKVYEIYEILSDSMYEYIWVIHDHTVFNDLVIKYIKNELLRKCDFLYLDMQAQDFHVKEVTSLNEFYMRRVWGMNSFGTVIIRRDSFLRDIDWDKMYKRFLYGRAVNYSHVGLYLTRLSEMDSPSVYELYFPRDNFFDFYRNDPPAWKDDTLRICLECWGEMIKLLPPTYRQKEKAMKTQDKWFISKHTLLYLKRKNKYGFVEFLRYLKWMIYVCPNKIKDALIISLLPYVFARYYVGYKIMRRIKLMRNKGAFICIYGAGRHACECLTYLSEYKEKPDAILVTKKDGNPLELNGCKVYEESDYLQGRKCFVIIAVLSSGVLEIEKLLEERIKTGADIKYIAFEE